MTGDTIKVGHDEITFLQTTESTSGSLVAAEVTIPAGGGPPMMHRHPSFELYRVNTGELTVYAADDDGSVTSEVAGAGEVVAITSGREHTIRNESASDATAYVVFVPGNEMEQFSRAAGQLAATTTPAPEDIAALAADHGIEITRPIQRDGTRVR